MKFVTQISPLLNYLDLHCNQAFSVCDNFQGIEFGKFPFLKIQVFPSLIFSRKRWELPSNFLPIQDQFEAYFYAISILRGGTGLISDKKFD